MTRLGPNQISEITIVYSRAGPSPSLSLECFTQLIKFFFLFHYTDLFDVLFFGRN